MKRFPMQQFDSEFLKPGDCPRTASSEVKSAWNEILRIAPKRLTKSDLLTVLNASRLLSELCAAELEIQEKGRTVLSSGREMVAPWVTRLQNNLGLWLKFSKVLGLDPLSRSGNPEMQEKLVSPKDIDEFLCL